MNLLHLYMIRHCKYNDLHMDDFENDFPDFNWRNVPAYKHPQGKDCPCPKHEYIREQINIAKAVSNNNRDISPDHRQKAQISLKLCPDHYKVYFNEVVPSMPLKYRIMTKIALKIGAVVIHQIPYMQSDQCFYCKFGSGGFDKKTPIIR